MADDVVVKKTSTTEYMRRYTEKEMETLLAEDLKSRSKMPDEFKAQYTTHKVMIDSSDSVGGGPRREYVVTVTVDHGAS